MKIVILADNITNKGGIERIILAQAKKYGADIITGRYNPNTTFTEFKKLNIIHILAAKPHSRINTLKLWFKYKNLKLDYDYYILHGTGALNAAKNNKPNIWYCHSPSRYLYDLYEDELIKLVGIRRLVFPLVTHILRNLDQNNVKNVDKILVNSRNVQDRVKKYYGRESKVIYPFVDINNFKFIEHGNFYLSSGRLDSIKRVHLVVKTFQKLSNKKLIIISHGPEETKIKNMCKNYNNIEFKGPVSEQELYELYGKCKATLYLSYKEDFGIIPIESMAAGKPCIATNEGGFKETIIHKKTGYLVNNPEDINQVINAVGWIDKNATKLKKYCESRSRLFSKKMHFKKLGRELS